MKKLGVLGGMGPAASAEFYQQLVAATPAARDQDHIPTMIWSDPTVPDRSTSILDGNDAPWESLKQGILGLKACGCDHIVIPCNTAHFWYDRMAQLGLPITHIVDSVAEELVLQGIEKSTVGIIGTAATMQLGLYDQRLTCQGWNCIVPTDEEMQTLIQPAIVQIKANDYTSAHDLLITAIELLISRGARAVVLGCTEIPLAVPESSWAEIPLINSINSLVKSTVKQFNIV